MRLLVAIDGHVVKTPDNNYWCKTIYGYEFFKRYMSVFDDIVVVARVKSVRELAGKYKKVNGKGVEVKGIPFYQGPWQLLIKLIPVHLALINVDKDCDAVILRLPSRVSQDVYYHIKKNKPIAGEIVYDPSDDLKRNDIGVINRILYKRISDNLRKFCKKANGVSYVTERTIQKNYPSYAQRCGEDEKHFEASYSTITMGDDAFGYPREYKKNKDIRLIMCDVSINSNRKGEDVFLKAISMLRNRGIEAYGTIVGDGSMLDSFKSLAKQLGIYEYVCFTGLLPTSADVQKVMKQSDLFVFPTHAEGLPRGVIEAMAVGLPVLTTPVGGIPEIIDNQYLLSPDDPEGFANEIERLFNNPNEMTAMSKRNYMKSLEYSNEKLQKKRDDFYSKLYRLCQNARVKTE